MRVDMCVRAYNKYHDVIGDEPVNKFGIDQHVCALARVYICVHVCVRVSYLSTTRGVNIYRDVIGNEPVDKLGTDQRALDPLVAPLPLFDFC